VPSDYAEFDKRGIVKLSTKIKVANDRTGNKATRVAVRMNETHEAYWRGLAESKAIEARQAYADAVKLARSLGLDYQPPPTIAQQPPRRSARWFGARGDASAPERLPALLRSGRQFFGSGDEAIQEAQAAAEREAQHLFAPPQLQGSAKGSRSSEGAGRRTDGACHREAAIRRPLRLEAQAEISSSDRLDAAAA